MTPTVPFSRLNALDILFLLRDVINALDEAGLVQVNTTDGHRDLVATAAQLEALVPKIEAILVEHGVVIPGKAEQIIAALPLVLSLAGIS